MNMFCYFAHFRAPGPTSVLLDASSLAKIAGIVAAVPGLSRALLHQPTPAGTRHAFPNDESGPPLAIQLYADRIEALEEALRADGALQALSPDGSVDGLRGMRVQQQIMLVRVLPMEPLEAPAPQANRCSYLVHYPGQAADLSAWHRHYIDHHPPIMRKFPKVREIEICTRLDWIGGLPGMRVDFMQRNKLMFDSPDDLSAALASPVIREMRADFHRFPEFAGGNVHYPMLTTDVPLASAANRSATDHDHSRRDPDGITHP
jgi:uncharacterized protein (TIGR02118 family)